MQPHISPAGRPPGTTDPVPVFPHLLRTCFCRWNWKAAVLSASGRAPIFLATTCAFGWRRASLAAAVDTGYRAGAAGFAAALVQELREYRPIWFALMSITVAIPAVLLWWEYLLHLAMRTPNLREGMLVSLVISAVMSLFDWYSMRRGALLVGEGQRSFLDDLCQLPRLAGAFASAPLVWLWRNKRRIRLLRF